MRLADGQGVVIIGIACGFVTIAQAQTMTPESFRQLEELYHAVCDLPATERRLLLETADPHLRDEVEAMLAADGKVLDHPAWEGAATLLAPATVAPGSQLGPYKIEQQIGQGGMGLVFRALDTRLGRHVAIKTSREEFSERFNREARAIASLNHPHICSLYDAGPNYLVMELLEGEPLDTRIKKGPLPIGETMRYGAQIASALAAAHAKGIIHRDLKPANIMLTKSGVKVLDFGLAKSHGDDTLTAANMVIGTPAYMPPEQRAGQATDARTDIYALGLLLYEMATGKRLPWDALPSFDSLTPPRFAHIVAGCLATEPSERWQSASDISKQLEWTAREPDPARVEPRPKRSILWVLAGAIGLTAVIGGLYALRQQHPAQEPVSFTLQAPLDLNMRQEIAVVSPDGRAIAFSGSDSSGQNFLWVRTLESITFRKLAGTEEASSPFWSPDGRFLAFFTGAKLKKVSLDGAPPQTICNSTTGLGGTWSPFGDIVFNPINRAPLMRVSSAGGTPQQLTTLDASRLENSHRWPSFLPDGRHFLFTARASLQENTAIYVGSLDSKGTKRILAAQSNGVYSPPGYLLFVRDGNLMAQFLDLNKLELSGEALPVTAGVSHAAASANGFFSVSADGGTLVYVQGNLPLERLTWFDREGNAEPFGPDGQYLMQRISPDGKRVVYTSTDSATGNRDVWLMDLSTNVPTRLTTHPANDGWPSWSADGQWIAFASDRMPRSSLYRMRADGSGDPELLLFPEGAGGVFDSDWSPDGRFLVYQLENKKNLSEDLWLLPLTGDRKPRPLLATDFDERSPAISPDGKWLAYSSTESGAREIYLRSMSLPVKVRVSINGGTLPFWRGDGKELFYAAAGSIHAAGIQWDQTPKVALPTVLFRGCNSRRPDPTLTSSYHITRDGKRFLFSCLPDGAGRRSLTVAIGWAQTLKRSGVRLP